MRCVRVEITEHTAPGIGNIARCTPEITYAGTPGPDIALSPVTETEGDGTSGTSQGIANLRVLGLRIDPTTTTPINLNVVDAPGGVRVGICCS